jgi:hypothetical protein
MHLSVVGLCPEVVDPLEARLVVRFKPGVRAIAVAAVLVVVT